jgi:hypothetical protein
MIIGVGLMSSAWCFGFHVVVSKVFFEEILGYDIDNDWDDYPRWFKLISKPVWACPYCMASLHGATIFFIFLVGSLSAWYVIPFCICLCGFNFVITKFLTD